jgi:hypothetical protein
LVLVAGDLIAGLPEGIRRPSPDGRDQPPEEALMSWFWMNIPAALACVAAWSGIPLYMVLKHRSWSTEPADSIERPVVESLAMDEGYVPVLPSLAVADAAE